MRHHYRPNHTYSSFKSHKNTQLTKDQTSPRSSSFHHKIVKPPLFASADPSNPEIYFNKLKRKSYLKNVIDNYFSTPIPQSKLQSTLVPSRASRRNIKRKDIHTSDSTRQRHKIQNKAFQFNVGSIEAGQQLPIISQIGFIKRPISSQKSQRSAFFRKVDHDDSIFNDSSRSIYDSKMFTQQLAENQNKSNISVSSTQKIKRMNVRTFNGDKDEQFLREKLIKKLGYTVSWQTTQKNTVFLYPVIKNLQQICYSVIEDKKGDDPLILIYPKDYYFSLFANQCEELKDIVRCIAKIINKGKGLVSSNQINMQNITKIQQKRFEIYDWSCAAILEALKVQDKVFNKFHIPYCKVEEKWMTAPEYLAPELLRAVQLQSYEHLWGQKGGISACDVWSLGCLLLEIITLIPLGQINHCAIKGGSHSKRGILGIKTPTADGLLQKHKYFRTLALRRLKDHLHQFRLTIPQKIIDLLPRMLESDPSKRISITEILQVLE